MKKSILAFTTIALACAVACTPAQKAEVQSIEALVAKDLAAGDSLPQVEADVAKLIAGQPGADAVIVLNDALILLIDAGILPPNLLSVAETMLASEAPKAAAHRSKS